LGGRNIVGWVGGPSGNRESSLGYCFLSGSDEAGGARELVIGLESGILLDLLLLVQDTEILIEGDELFCIVGDFAFIGFLDYIASIHLIPFDVLDGFLIGFQGCRGASEGFLFCSDPFLGLILEYRLVLVVLGVTGAVV
jgi:hypothetical protein